MAEQRRFLVGIPRGLLIAGLVVALLYLVWLVLIAGRYVVIRSGTTPIDPVVWVWVGAGLFGLLLVLGLFALVPARSRPDDEEPMDAVEAIPAAIPTYEPPMAETAYAPQTYAPPVTPKRRRDDVEIKVAPEDYKGKRVVELSIPPKSANKGGVYAKAYVPVDDTLVLRVEDLVADKRDTAA